MEMRRMSTRVWVATAILALSLPVMSTRAFAQDVELCFAAADRTNDGDTLDDGEKRKAHEACLRALSDTSSIVQKYQLQEADFDIMGNRPKQ
jgi:hypothetical protein